MSVTIKHVKHCWQGERRADPRIFLTVCGTPFYPFGHPRDFAVHEPAHSRCPGCYR